MSAQVLVIGDANLDLVLRGDVRPRFGQAEQLLDAADLTLGGSGALVAHGLARLEVPVALCAAIGDDAFGDRCLALLSDAGVALDLVVRRPGVPTGLSVVLSDDDRAILTHLGAIDSLTAAELPAPEALPGLRHVHVASPYLVSGTRPHLPGYLAGLRAAGVRVSLDTNDDPARAWADLAGLIDAADWVLPNDSEALHWAAALGLDAGTALEAAAAVSRRGPVVVLKSGGDGGRVFESGILVAEAAPPPAELVDTTGAGDTFDAGVIAAALMGHPWGRALLWGIHAGARSVSAPGGAASQPGRAELMADLGPVDPA